MTSIAPASRQALTGMRVQALWRYPVKSLRGEPLDEALLTADGIAGDRRVHVSGPNGPLTGRTRGGLVTVPASTGPDGQPRVAGHPWRSAAAGDVVRAHAGPYARLRADDQPQRFDVTNLLVATDGELAALPGPALDVRRLRPNLVLSGVPGLHSAGWPGAALAIGEVLIGVHSRRPRCIVTATDPDTGEQDLEVFRRIRRDADNLLALNCWVIRPGAVRVGDAAHLVPSTARPAALGGWITGAPYRPGDGDGDGDVHGQGTL